MNENSVKSNQITGVIILVSLLILAYLFLYKPYAYNKCQNSCIESICYNDTACSGWGQRYACLRDCVDKYR